MSILIECPICHKKHCCKKQTLQMRSGPGQGQAVEEGPVSGSATGCPGGSSGASLSELNRRGRDADGKRRGQKREGRIFEMLPDAKLTFKQIAEWYLKLSSVKKLASYPRIAIALNNFNGVFGQRVAGTVLPIDLEEYQAKRTRDGLAPSTIDVELNIARGMVSKAFDNDKLDGRTFKAFRRVKNLTKRGCNARKRTVRSRSIKNSSLRRPNTSAACW